MNIVITGASSGIGYSIYKKLLSNENQIIIISRTSPLEIEKNVKWIKADLSTQRGVGLASNVLKDIKVDVLINNAGSGEVVELEELTYSTAQREFALNVIAPMMLTKIVAKKMKENNFGRIINITSISGVKATPYLFSYSASKAALINFTRNVAEYYRDYNILANSISPSGVNTEKSIKIRKEISYIRGLNDMDYQNEMIKIMGRETLISPEAIADFIDFLIKNDAINGQNINISGAM